MYQPPPQNCRRSGKAVVCERRHGIVQLWRIRCQPAVPRVRCVAAQQITDGKKLRRKLPPAIGESCIKRNRTLESSQRLGATATRGVSSAT